MAGFFPASPMMGIRLFCLAVLGEFVNFVMVFFANQ